MERPGIATSKALIVCCDGTWKRVGYGDITNVALLAHGLATRNSEGSQICFYQHGVGSSIERWNWIQHRVEKALVGLLGRGLDRNIEECYRFICNNFQIGDRLYLIGFSRGAYTARCLAGLIGRYGIIDKNKYSRYLESNMESSDPIRQAMTLYRKRDQLTQEQQEFISAYCYDNDRSTSVAEPANAIEAVAVWDTVGTMGVPSIFPRLSKYIRRKKRLARFHDLQLGDHVKAGFHAVATHEFRKAYNAALWTNETTKREIEQRWFIGSHSDVGGGSDNPELSTIALHWMVNQLTDAGLEFQKDFIARLNENRESASINRIENSRTCLFKFQRRSERTLGRYATETCDPSIGTWISNQKALPKHLKDVPPPIYGDQRPLKNQSEEAA